MDALDLTKNPPRSSRATIGDIPVPMLARTVDKLRAEQPGGDLGAYQLAGFSTKAMELLGIDPGALREAVRTAKDDADIAAWLKAHATADRFREANDYFEAQVIRDRLDRPGWLDKYPIARTLPPETKVLDMLDADDAAMFA